MSNADLIYKLRFKKKLKFGNFRGIKNVIAFITLKIVECLRNRNNLKLGELLKTIVRHPEKIDWEILKASKTGTNKSILSSSFLEAETKGLSGSEGLAQSKLPKW